MTSARLSLALLPLAVLIGIGTPAKAATFVVSSAADTDDGVCGEGHCTFREAIRAANGSPGADQIVFLIRPLDETLKSIRPLSPLPLVSDAAGVVISGLTQSGSAASTRTNGTSNARLRVEIDGTLAGSPANGLVVAGGPTRVEGLIINRFANSGIQLAGGTGHEVADNYIGTDASGLVALGNGDDGVDVLVPGCRVSRNLISGNHRDGIELAGESSGTAVEGNLIGVAATGEPALGNWRAGVAAFTAGNQIGGLGSGTGNYVGGNLDAGIVCVTSDSHDNVIQANSIFGNRSHGILITVDAARNRIGRGGGFVQPSNTIADNGGNGVCVTASAGTPNSVLPFRVERNELIGIDFTGGDEDEYGVTPNDPLDADEGPNDLQNWPLLEGAVTDGLRVWVYGTFLGRPGADLVVSFYAGAVCHRSGHGDGRLVGGGFVAQTGADGKAWGQAEIAATAGELVSAVAIDADGNSSEFSNCVPVVFGSTPTAEPTPTPTEVLAETETPTPLPPSPTAAEETPTSTPSPTPEPSQTEVATLMPTVTFTSGDANCDGVVSAADPSEMARQIGLGLRRCGADVDGDLVLDGRDLSAIVRLLFGP